MRSHFLLMTSHSLMFSFLSLHDALPIYQFLVEDLTHRVRRHLVDGGELANVVVGQIDRPAENTKRLRIEVTPDRKSTRLNSSHLVISYAVFCLKKKNVHTG